MLHLVYISFLFGVSRWGHVVPSGVPPTHYFDLCLAEGQCNINEEFAWLLAVSPLRGVQRKQELRLLLQSGVRGYRILEGWVHSEQNSEGMESKWDNQGPK